MPDSQGSSSFQPPDPGRQQTSTSPDDPAVIRQALGQKPNTGTRPPVTPVRGSSGGNPAPINHSIAVDKALEDAGA
jgi:hypothetical protein